VRGDLLDLALLVIAAAFAVSGYRQGFIVGSLSFIGFVGGAVLGAEFGPSIAHAIVGGQTQQDVVAVILLVSFAIIGQFIASSVGAAMRQTMTGRGSTTIDAIGGSGVSVLSMLLIAWAIGSVLISSPFPVVDQQVNNSVVLGTLDKVMPSPAKTMFSEFRRMLASGPFPQVFSDIGAAHLFPVQAPDPAVLNSPGYKAAASRVVKVQGTAPSCDRSIEGSGFLYAPHHVLTNAHVVAGVTQGPVVTTPDGATYRASVVFYDPQVDIAVLYVPSLNARPLHLAPGARRGSEAIVAGYPGGRALTAAAARIGAKVATVSPSIYRRGAVIRHVYTVRAGIQPGDSGSPLLATDGSVYGMVFAALTGTSDAGYALAGGEISPAVRAAASRTAAVSTQPWHCPAR